MRLFCKIFLFAIIACLAACSKTASQNQQMLPSQNSSSVKTVNKLVLPMQCDNALLSKAAMQLLDQQANFLLANRNVNVIMQSFSPAAGSEDLNLARSQMRAQAAANYLGLKGVNLNRIQVQSYGGAYDTSLTGTTPCQVVLLDQS